ncbi:MAG TPA: TetR/AcrR family transcriptional regulator [Candidatus Melainabacteria bacterium]|nr:TetR/AcrR family transcriptional regulator [Candidatus Melainabacteria bacterium]HIN66882.1 TetR/AcrR family transcriptional regulator [Candidatus Obscuribacterales bacterium]
MQKPTISIKLYRRSVLCQGDLNLGRREEKREATRQEILTAARAKFQEKGYDATSVDDLVLAANVAKGTFYYHFNSKDELLHALQEMVIEEFAEKARQKLTEGNSPLKVLSEFVSEMAKWNEANSDLSRAVFAEKFTRFSQSHGSHGNHCSIEEKKRKFVGLIVELITLAQKAGEIRTDVEADDLVRVILPPIMFTTATWLFNPEGSLSERLERSLTLVLEGVRPQ